MLKCEREIYMTEFLLNVKNVMDCFAIPGLFLTGIVYSIKAAREFSGSEKKRRRKIKVSETHSKAA